ncbi:glucan 1,4-alpha-glucosidase [Halorarum halophilum]|uniref:Glucan 1,4-alpha-glucosidase n=1 Tax=Halorarum halophilum TaxID=2743090 RepID=A0A7D5KVL3_9EURY|nr:glycoside hydrolase family 15 protein [Halobaculum halophilum]QLG29120.1 glucan 1,4-alpha-glucosidase [Halobaculum halophilum]
MHLRFALEDARRHEGDSTRFPGERRTVAGRFTGDPDGDRLLHVEPDGTIADFGYPFSRRAGIAAARFGIETNDGVAWFDDDRCEPVGQRYHEDTALVVTEVATPNGRVELFDLALGDGDAHVRHVRGLAAPLVAAVAFAPDGRTGRVAQLHHSDAVEAYHAHEHDYIAAADGFREVRGEAVPNFDALRNGGASLGESGEEAVLSGAVVAVAEPTEGAVTLSTLPAGRDREAGLARVREAAREHDGPTALRSVATEHTLADTTPTPAVASDLRVLSLLRGTAGRRIAGPEFDRFYANSGGYGYTWFRDDAEIAGFLLEADREFDLGLTDWHAKSARAYCDAQGEDGTWPHRVWPGDGALAPGWANDRLTDGGGDAYQADQTASVLSFLAAYREHGPASGVADDVDEAIADGVDAMLADTADDGRPVRCQNAWEDMHGRFTHTAATFLEGYAAVAATDHPDAHRARDAAGRVSEAIEDLWVPERGAYALRTDRDEVDDRLDSATLALADAYREYARIAAVDDVHVERLLIHLEATLGGLRRTTDAVDGLVRYEGDPWRRQEQAREKVWTVSTAWGARAAASVGTLLRERGDDRANDWFGRSHRLLALVAPDGPLSTDADYLPEQRFDDGTPDSATPLGWPHAIRSATLATLTAAGASTPAGLPEKRM